MIPTPPPFAQPRRAPLGTGLPVVRGDGVVLAEPMGQLPKLEELRECEGHVVRFWNGAPEVERVG